MVQPSILKVTNIQKRLKRRIFSFIFHNDWLQNQCWLSVKGYAPNFNVVVIIILSLYCQIGSTMPYLCIYVEETVALFGQ